MIRATTGGVLKSYRANLMNSFISMNKSRDTVLSQRNFNSYAEDPAAAAKAFRLRKSRMTVDSQHSICSDTLKKYQTAYSCLQSMDEIIDTKGSDMTTLKEATLEWLDDPKGDAREQLSKVLDRMSEILVQNMNQKYGDNFIFAGADGHNVPFEIKDHKLYYRGVSVDAAIPNVMGTKEADGSVTPLEINAGATPPITSTNGGSYVKMDTSALIKKDDYDNVPAGDPKPTILIADDTTAPPTPQAFDSKGNVVDPNTYTGDIYYLDMTKAETMTVKEYDAQKLEAEKLEYLKNEKYYVDIGLGFQEDKNGNLIPSSGFNAALNGINFFGCGLDEDGDPKNIYSIVQKLTEISDSASEGGDWGSVYDEFKRLVGKLETASSNFKTEFTNMAASTTKLENNEKLLEDNFYNLQEQYAALEDVDMVDSITSFIWAQYCYNAALKVGNNVLSESLMDYLR